jgi:hypothetical protein
VEFSSANSISTLPPASDEFEIVIFGPGVGECILMHLGNGDWFVIDSCRFPGSKKAAALEYLEALSIEPSSAIKRILATHWHDDHVNGLSDIVRRCPNATFAMSAALASDQFFQLVYDVDNHNKLVSANSTASEFADILDQFASMGQVTPAPDLFVSDGTLLFRGGFNDSTCIQALSPSAAAISNATTAVIANLVTNTATRQFRRFDPNDLSVAVQVTAGAIDLLLKADLENTNEPEFGWRAVLSSAFRPNRRNRIVKVGHHGSRNADNDSVWNTMVEANPVSVVTPYSRLAKPLPRTEDIRRIKKRTNQLYATTWPPSSSPQRRLGVDGYISGATTVRKAINRVPGFVRVRFDLNHSAPSLIVELYGSARKM